jgi:dihydrolipoamide dehydrogenase
MKQKDDAVRGLTGGIEMLFKKNKVSYFKGWGSIPAAGKVAVAPLDGSAPNTLSAKNIIIATGSDIMSIPNVTINDAGYKIVSSTGALSLPAIPKHLVVIGGGVIGLEMGSVWKRFGAEVTVVEFMDRILPGMDLEVSSNFQKILAKQGFSFKLNTKVLGAEETKKGVVITTESVKGGASEKIEADVVLVSTGRKPNTSNLGLEALGVKMDRGRILVDHRNFQTNVPGIFAIGDCVPGPMLAHKAEEDGIACAESIAGKGGHVNYDTVPNVVYTHPEIATVGKTEEQVKALNIKYKVGKFPFMANSRARTVADAEGFVKVISDAETDTILGMHIIGPNAGELIAEGVLGMEYGASSEDLARTCHAHPTLSEAVKEAMMATYDKPIHF